MQGISDETEPHASSSALPMHHLSIHAVLANARKRARRLVPRSGPTAKGGTCLLFLLGMSIPGMGVLNAQALVGQGLSVLPVDTSFLEYDSLARLRSLPNYSAVAKRYTGSGLAALRSALGDAGIAEDSVDEIVIGSRSRSGAGPLYGVFAGSFDMEELARSAAARKFVVGRIAKTPVYCSPSERGGICFASLGGATNVFGTFSRIYSMVESYEGAAPALSASRKIFDLLSDEGPNVAVKGLAYGTGLADWIRSALPSQGAAQLNWSNLFSGVSMFSYTIGLSDKTHLQMQLECVSAESAAILQQSLNMLGLLGTVAEPGNSSNKAPFSNLDVKVSGDIVHVEMDAPLPST